MEKPKEPSAAPSTEDEGYEHVHGESCEHHHHQPPQRFVTKIGRNEPCPCGSGRKHKKCCLGKE